MVTRSIELVLDEAKLSKMTLKMCLVDASVYRFRLCMLNFLVFELVRRFLFFYFNLSKCYP